MLRSNNSMKPVFSILLITGTLLAPKALSAEDLSLSSFQPQLSDDFKVLLANADRVKGEMLFERKCSACHDANKDGGHGKGPLLWNIVNRKAGTAEGFSEFSDAMINSGHRWTLDNLNYYLNNTKQAVPGRSMNFRGIKKDSDRAALLAFLRTLAD